MITKHLGLLAAGALLASIGGANAGQVTLTDAQLDRVSAGSYGYVEAYGNNIMTNTGIFAIYAGAGFASAAIYANVTPVDNPPHWISVNAYAVATPN